MSVNSFTKFQIENVTKTIDLSGLAEIQDGETIASCTVEISKDGLLDDTGMLVSKSNTNSEVIFRVKDGTINTRYLIIIVVITSESHVRQSFINMIVE